MQNSSDNTYARDKLSSYREKYSLTVEKQRTLGKHCPILFVGESWAGKDTIADGVIEAFYNEIWAKLSKTSARFLTRTPRDWEENWPLNFISDKDFDQRNFLFDYDVSGYRYGIDAEILLHELAETNVCIMWTSRQTMWLFDRLVGLAKNNPHVISPLIVNIKCNPENIETNIDGRSAPEEEKRKRKRMIGKLRSMEDALYGISFFEGFVHRVDNILEKTPEWNRFFYEENIYLTSQAILDHISTYVDEVDMYQRVIQERIDANCRHVWARP